MYKLHILNYNFKLAKLFLFNLLYLKFFTLLYNIVNYLSLRIEQYQTLKKREVI